MRSKEEANDYRYFPDPDLLPVEVGPALIEAVRATLPELPDQKAARFSRQYGLSPYDAGVLTGSRELAEYYEEVVRTTAADPKLAANWVMGDLAAALNREGLEVSSAKISAARLGELLGRIHDATISGKIAKEVFELMIQHLKLDESGYRGTRLRDHGHDLKGNNDILTLTQPEAVRDIHRAYLAAGADIIETNTFNSNAISQTDYGTAALVPELNYRAARLAREVADQFALRAGGTRFVAGALGPTNRMTMRAL